MLIVLDAFVQVALEASTVPPEGASEQELERHRLAKLVDGLIDRKVYMRGSALHTW